MSAKRRLKSYALMLEPLRALLRGSSNTSGLPQVNTNTTSTRSMSTRIWTSDRLHSQHQYAYSTKHQRWDPIKTKDTGAIPPLATSAKFSVLSWNIDFMLPLAKQRMASALKHLESIVSHASNPCIILLQEMTAPDINLIKNQPWIQSSYNLTDVNIDHWKTSYGTCTMIPNSMAITSVSRLYYEHTNMHRDALFVDIAVEGNNIVRICNTHLESLIADPPLRPIQLQAAAKYMHDASVHASILGGDLNAIQPFDKTLHVENDLQDGFLACGGQEDAMVGFTWGQMAKTTVRDQFGLSRMDKLLFCGAVGIEKFETFGFGVEVEDEEDRQMLMRVGLEAGWVTDHLGVRGDFYLVPGDNAEMT